jgi:dTDP-4-dehydrorhamnose reductase
MQPRLLIIGATGFIGSRLAERAQQQFTVSCGSRHPTADDRSIEIDIANPDGVRHAFERTRPDFVIHLATMSDIDRCERERDLAKRINYHGTVNVVRQCADRGARLLFTSSDAVFAGTKGIYYETDDPSPLNWYGQTKALAERAIAEILPSALIVRPSLVLGVSMVPGGNSYLDKVVGNLKAGNSILAPTVEFRNPIDVCTLCDFLLELLPQANISGAFHAGASDKISRYDLTCAIADRLGYDRTCVVAQNDPVPGRAPRGRDDFLDTSRLRQVCHTGVPNCQQVIERAVSGVA